jgi:CTP synthase
LYGGQSVIHERHRHRYEVNPRYVPPLEEAGLRFSGHDDRSARMEIVEIPGHRFYLGVQFHPEFK